MLKFLKQNPIRSLHRGFLSLCETVRFLVFSDSQEDYDEYRGWQPINSKNVVAHAERAAKTLEIIHPGYNWNMPWEDPAILQCPSHFVRLQKISEKITVAGVAVSAVILPVMVISTASCMFSHGKEPSEILESSCMADHVPIACLTTLAGIVISGVGIGFGQHYEEKGSAVTILRALAKAPQFGDFNDAAPPLILRLVDAAKSVPSRVTDGARCLELFVTMNRISRRK